MYYVKPMTDSSGQKRMVNFTSTAISVTERDHRLEVDGELNFIMNGEIPSNSVYANIRTSLVDWNDLTLTKMSETTLNGNKAYKFKVFASSSLYDSNFYKTPMFTKSNFEAVIDFHINSSILEETHVKFNNNDEYALLSEQFKLSTRYDFYGVTNVIDLTGPNKVTTSSVNAFHKTAAISNSEVIGKKSSYEPTLNPLETLFELEGSNLIFKNAKIVKSEMSLDYTLRDTNETKSLKTEPTLTFRETKDKVYLDFGILDWISYDKKKKELFKSVSNTGGIFINADSDIRIDLLAKVEFKDIVRFIRYSDVFHTTSLEAMNVLNKVKINNHSKNKIGGDYIEIKSSEIL